MHVLGDRESHRSFAARRSEILNRGNAAQDVRKQHIKDGTDDERTEDADRHIALGILRFLGCRGDGIKTDICKEDDARGPENALTRRRSGE